LWEVGRRGDGQAVGEEGDVEAEEVDEEGGWLGMVSCVWWRWRRDLWGGGSVPTRKLRKQRRVMGWDDRRQLSSPGRACCCWASMIEPRVGWG